jgi:type II secretion system protein N
MKANAKRWGQYVGYPVVYFLMLGMFARCTFPYDSLRNRVVSEFNGKQAASGMRLEIGELSGYWLLGVKASNVKLTKTPLADATSTESADEQKPKVTAIDELHASVSLLRLLVGNVGASFGATIKSGEIDGAFSSSDAEQSLSINLKQVGVNDLPMLGDLAGLPLKGTVDGLVELVLPEKKAGKAEGKIELNISGLSAGDGKAKVLKVIALPELRLGNVKLAATVTEGRVKLDAMTAKGPDFEMAVDGSIRLREPISSSMLDVGMRFKFLDSYKNKNDMTKGLFGTNGMPGLFDMNDKVRRAKREDGFYGWRVIGVMENPTVEPNPAGTSSTGRGSARTVGARRPGKVINGASVGE